MTIVVSVSVTKRVCSRVRKSNDSIFVTNCAGQENIMDPNSELISEKKKKQTQIFNRS